MTVRLSNLYKQVYGWVLENGKLSGRFGGFTTYFVAQFSTNFIDYGVWDGKQVLFPISFALKTCRLFLEVLVLLVADVNN